VSDASYYLQGILLFFGPASQVQERLSYQNPVHI